jgi:uncharacterized protein YqjF (DUF2071 family)
MIIMTGSFRHIIQLSYAVDPKLMKPYLPPHTEPDIYNGAGYIGIVGVQPLALKIYGLPFPWFRHRAQVNLRFYVRRRVVRGEWRHGVVFITQIVPHPLLAWGIRWLYNEPVEWREIDCSVQNIGHEALQVQYSWGSGKQHFIRAAYRQQPLFAAPAAEQDFFIDRHWGYTAQRDGSCLEYRFNHPPWRTYTARQAEAAAVVGEFYGAPFSGMLRAQPDIAFGCRGSNFMLERGRRL